MMKKMLFFALFLAFLGTVCVNAQVRIGGSIKPQAAAVLDLNVDSTATPANKGALALPRVNLTSAAMPLNGATPNNGMLIYNTGTTFPVGVYVWITDKWVKADAANPLKITAQPKSFSFSRLQNAGGDPNGPATATVANLTVTATGSGTLTYQWYEKPKNMNNTSVIKLTGNGATTYTYTPVVTNWGLRSYYCVVSNGTDSVVSNYADVAIGCGAKTNDGRWISYMCFNLGANPNIDPFTYSSTNDTTSYDIKGWLFQWGRGTNSGAYSDGHQYRSSALARVDTCADLSAKDQYAATDKGYGKFVYGVRASNYDWHVPAYDFLWYGYKTASDPCPSGWRLPTQTDFGEIVGSGTGSIAPSASTANVWTWATGFQIKPDGSTTTLFLPAAGNRNGSNGALGNVGSHGYYWSSTVAASGAYNLYFNSGRLSPGDAPNRANGRSIRCVAE